MAEHDPFSDWSQLLHQPVFTSDGKKIGFLRSVVSDYMIVKRGFINLRKYFVPTSLAESVSNNGIRLHINSFDARTKYSSFKSKRFVQAFKRMPESEITERPLCDRLQTLRHGTTRNRIAAGAAFVSGILFLLSGYKANQEIYSLVLQQLSIYTPRNLWTYVFAPIGILALFSQLGGIAVLIGAGFFAANRINLGKFLVYLGTGQGLLTIGLRLLTEIWSGRLAQFGLENNYVTWLTTSAAGLGVLFAIVAPTVAKGKGPSLGSRAIRFVLRRRD